jgi:hypothetical protein
MIFLSLRLIVILGLDKVTNLMFQEDSTDKRTALIYFDRPRGNYDRVYLTCVGQDLYCFNENTYLMNSTGNCSDCNFISIFPIIRGVTYSCHATTVEQNFDNVISDEYRFNTRKKLRTLEIIFQYFI